MTIVSKIHESGRELVLAACDEGLLNKRLTGDDGAEVFINPNFYNGEEVNEARLLELVANATIVNLFGEETVQTALSEGLVTEESVLKFDNVPHVQIFTMARA